MKNSYIYYRSTISTFKVIQRSRSNKNVAYYAPDCTPFIYIWLWGLLETYSELFPVCPLFLAMLATRWSCWVENRLEIFLVRENHWNFFPGWKTLSYSCRLWDLKPVTQSLSGGVNTWVAPPHQPFGHWGLDIQKVNCQYHIGVTCRSPNHVKYWIVHWKSLTNVHVFLYQEKSNPCYLPLLSGIWTWRPPCSIGRCRPLISLLMFILESVTPL